MVVVRNRPQLVPDPLMKGFGTEMIWTPAWITFIACITLEVISAPGETTDSIWCPQWVQFGYHGEETLTPWDETRHERGEMRQRVVMLSAPSPVLRCLPSWVSGAPQLSHSRVQSVPDELLSWTAGGWVTWAGSPQCYMPQLFPQICSKNPLKFILGPP